MKNLKLSILFIVAGLILGTIALAEMSAELYPNYADSTKIEPTAMDLLQAKFTDIKPLASNINAEQGDNFPNYYFTVKETVTGQNAKDWGKVSNLVAVFYREIPSGHNQPKDIIQYREFNGRTQAYIYKYNYYLVVTGPDREKVANLLNILVALIS